MSLLNCDENCKVCITYFSPNGSKVLKCKPKDAYEIIMISFLLLICLVTLSLCVVLILINLKRKKQNILEKINKEERIKLDSNLVKSRRVKNLIKRKQSRLNLMDLNKKSVYKNKKATDDSKKIMNYSETLNEEAFKNLNRNRKFPLINVIRASNEEV